MYIWKTSKDDSQKRKMKKKEYEWVIETHRNLVFFRAMGKK